ncbi:hypothetical protein BDZ94DRAFT_612120 [Collybia nuda]|uniref:Secreted protein n=1 Tax=Collybia nuda TaxID=64659 RepID=A0A9P6CK33_9AGAR|nr:hypothetical protein BDZ94DRAFT_612120 [Collybia nuda]
MRALCRLFLGLGTLHIHAFLVAVPLTAFRACCFPGVGLPLSYHWLFHYPDLAFSMMCTPDLTYIPHTGTQKPRLLPTLKRLARRGLAVPLGSLKPVGPRVPSVRPSVRLSGPPSRNRTKNASVKKKKSSPNPNPNPNLNVKRQYFNHDSDLQA